MPGGTATDNANGSSSGFSAIGGAATDLLVADDGVYITKIRDFGSTVTTGSVFVEIEGSQSIKTTFNDTHEDILSGVTEPLNSNVLRDVNFGGIGTVLGFANSSVVNPRFVIQIINHG